MATTMSLPGLVDVSSGVLLFAPNLRGSKVPVKQWLENEFDIPIYVDNKANMAALAESYFVRRAIVSMCSVSHSR